MTAEVRIRRPPTDERILLMRGRTTAYAIEPRGEYVFGLVERGEMHARRGAERHHVGPGQLVAWDPSASHAGSGDWSARLMLVRAEDLAEHGSAGVAAFRDPVIDDPALASGFAALHRALDGPASQLERDERLVEWLRAVVLRHGSGGKALSETGARDRVAAERARAHLLAAPERNVGLDELAAVAGVDRFRLIRVFREATGLPPHAFQVGLRVALARRLLEAGETPAGAAALAGFADQSHLHRHFRRSVGFTPGEYQRHFASA